MAKNNRSGPRVACELSQERVIAARLTDDGTALESYTGRAMAAGALTPHLAEANVANPEAVRQAVTDALTTVGSRSRDVVAILPDASVRVSLLDFDTLPEKRQDADSVVRFRLKKVLPFDVEKASVSYDVKRSNGHIRVVAAVVLQSVLQEYEAIFRAAGYSPGIVVPSTLAALGNIDGTDATLVIKSDSATTTLSIVGNGELLLFRTLENPGGVPPTAEVLAPDVHASLVFFQDSYNMRVDRILVGGLIDAEQVGPYLESQTEVRVQNLVAAQHVAGARPNFPASSLAGVVGALLG
ncbi:MAG: type IV pilus biogenesis protein PilM [Terriglobales bacterium]